MKNAEDKYIYFATVSGDIIDNFELSCIAEIVQGVKIDYNDFCKIREFANECIGIDKEIIPSIESLILFGKKHKAIKIYYRNHPGIGLREAKEYIDKLEKTLKEGNQ